MYAPSPGAPPPRRSNRRLVIAVVILVVVILVVGIFAVDYFTTPAGVTVNYITFWSNDNACGYNANSTSYYGYNSSTGQAQEFEFGLPNYNLTACTIHTMVTNSSGFSITGFTLPIQISGNGTSYVNITITSPSSSFNGDMNLVIG